MPGRTRREVLGLTTGVGLAGLAGCLDRAGVRSGGVSTPEAYPIRGEATPELQPIEDAVLEFMAARDVPGSVLGVARHGEVLLERGYGHSDAAREEPMAPDTLLRIASLSKALTRAAIGELVRAGRLGETDAAFDLLDLAPLRGDVQTERLSAVTVEHLLEHRGGWDRGVTYDPLFWQLEIALERGWDEPPGPERLIRHMLGQPLQFDPGTDRVYSNFGYLVLGRVIESVTGATYQEFLEEALFSPLGIEDVQLGRSHPSDRPGRESWYFDEKVCQHTLAVDPYELVRCPDGGFHQEATDASGGHVATVGALLAFMNAYWLDGGPRTSEQSRRMSYNGTLPGTFSMAVHLGDGVDVAVIFNQRGYDPNYLALEEALVAGARNVEHWPV